MCRHCQHCQNAVNQKKILCLRNFQLVDLFILIIVIKSHSKYRAHISKYFHAASLTWLSFKGVVLNLSSVRQLQISINQVFLIQKTGQNQFWYPLLIQYKFWCFNHSDKIHVWAAWKIIITNFLAICEIVKLQATNKYAVIYINQCWLTKLASLYGFSRFCY